MKFRAWVTAALLMAVAASCTLMQQPRVDDGALESTDEVQVSTPAGDTSTARAFLAGAELHQALVAPLPYVRNDYSPGGWSDSDGDCQSDRHEVLIVESVTPVTLSANGCRVETGLWIDRFDGQQYVHADEVTIDHLVALSAAHHAGAWAWDLESKQQFAHDTSFAPALGVTGASVNQAKAAKSPDQWRPPLEAAWCDYAVDWILVKVRWGLAFAINEAAALNEMLDTCTSADTDLVELANPTLAAPTVIVEPTPIEITADTAMVIIANCDARGETVTLENRGATPAVLDGWVLHDRDRNHSFTLDGLRVDSGSRLVIVTGEQASTDAAEVLWKRENVWNNSGDTASLLGTGSELVSTHDC